MVLFHWYHYALWTLKIAIEIWVFSRTTNRSTMSVFGLTAFWDILLLLLSLRPSSDIYFSAFVTANITGMVVFCWACCSIARIKHSQYFVSAIAVVLFLASPPVSLGAVMDEMRFVLFVCIAILLVGIYKETAGRLGWGLLALAGSQVVCAFLQPGMMHHMDVMRCIWMVSWMMGCSVIGWVSKTA